MLSSSIFSSHTRLDTSPTINSVLLQKEAKPVDQSTVVSRFVALTIWVDEAVSTIDPNDTHADLSCIPSRDR